MPKLSSDPLDILLAHNHWATRMLLERCRALTDEQFHLRFVIGLGSLHDTLAHIIGAMRRWTDRILERPLRPSIDKPPKHPDVPTDAPRRTPDQLLALLDESAAELTDAANNAKFRGLDTTIPVLFPREDGTQKTYTFTRGAALVHVTTHGMHHRAQCLNIMRRLNLTGFSDNLPEIAVVEWQSMTETHEL